MTTDPREKLLDLVQSHRVTAVIYVAARLGLAELLRDGPRTVEELASQTHADRDALARLLVALSTVGICSRVGEGRYFAPRKPPSMFRRGLPSAMVAAPRRYSH